MSWLTRRMRRRRRRRRRRKSVAIERPSTWSVFVRQRQEAAGSRRTGKPSLYKRDFVGSALSGGVRRCSQVITFQTDNRNEFSRQGTERWSKCQVEWKR